MQFWIGGRLDKEYTMAPEDVAEKFWVSPFGVNFLAQAPDAPRFNLDNALRRYIDAKEGMHSRFEPTDFPALLRVVAVHRPGSEISDFSSEEWQQISRDLAEEFHENN